MHTFVYLMSIRLYPIDWLYNALTQYDENKSSEFENFKIDLINTSNYSIISLNIEDQLSVDLW
jgi:hypothetical protein